ncbi:hypothetical protein J2I47_07860 [Fibrella sp. HMF5335]|uniref:Uncharacterized protein n=1 Tax=Fibrella rubiginis TaxID=2817060 RepID=A0A939K2M1_9BACT|nr:hypothetical protein [Fibrella rubiginis]MBO0936459.1 hypothetical protein [Fibrella rubiginis]
MKEVVILSWVLLCSYGCQNKNAMVGCSGPDRIVFTDAKGAFLESGFVFLDMTQDTSYAKRPYVNCQPCSQVNTARLHVQSDRTAIKLDYLITCGIKYDDPSRTSYLPVAPRVVIYSIKPL